MGETASILVCTHTDSFYLESELYQPIHVGKALHPEVDFNFIGDNTGDNISVKNGSYCELTAHYWAWKNLNVDYIGMCHYRRYFDFSVDGKIILSDMFDLTKEAIKRKNLGNPLTMLSDGTEVILPKPSFIPRSVALNYITSHIPEDFYVLCRTVLNLYPEYETTMRKFFFGSNRWIAYNMMFCRKELFDKYAEWLFTILSEVEKNVRVSDYSYQSRIYGFMGEILTPLFFLHNCKRIKYQPILYVSDNPCTVSGFTYLRNTLRYSLAFYLSCRPRSLERVDLRGSFYNNYFKKDGILL